MLPFFRAYKISVIKTNKKTCKVDFFNKKKIPFFSIPVTIELLKNTNNDDLNIAHYNIVSSSGSFNARLMQQRAFFSFSHFFRLFSYKIKKHAKTPNRKISWVWRFKALPAHFQPFASALCRVTSFQASVRKRREGDIREAKEEVTHRKRAFLTPAMTSAFGDCSLHFCALSSTQPVVESPRQRSPSSFFMWGWKIACTYTWGRKKKINSRLKDFNTYFSERSWCCWCVLFRRGESFHTMWESVAYSAFFVCQTVVIMSRGRSLRGNKNFVLSFDWVSKWCRVSRKKSEKKEARSRGIAHKRGEFKEAYYSAWPWYSTEC